MSANTTPMVLYVEDEILLREIVEIGLEEAGFGVVLAASGEEGLQILEDRSEAVTSVVTDINLGGGIDGWEVARRAREINPTVPVVYVSGKDGHEWTSKGVPSSVLITKPFAPAQIVVAISSLLNTSDKQD